MSNPEETLFPADEIVAFYDLNGCPLFYLYSDGEHFYDFDGEPLGYLRDKYILSYDGEYLGWVHDGWIIDYQDGSHAFFSQYASGGPVRPVRQVRPVRGVRQVRPVKGVRQVKPVKPVRNLGWSGRGNLSFFK